MEEIEQTPSNRLPHWLKTTLISLGAFVATLMVVCLVLCYLIFTPSRLTSIVNKLADRYILCEAHFEEVDLSLIHTFPNVGLKVSNLSLINSQLPARHFNGTYHTDTLAHIDQLILGVNLREFLRHRTVIVNQALLSQAQAHLFTDSVGHNNFDIFTPSADTSSSPLPELIDLKKVKVKSLSGSYVNRMEDFEAHCSDLKADLDGVLHNAEGQGNLSLSAAQLALALYDTSWTPTLKSSLDNLHLHAQAKGRVEALEGKVNLRIPQAHVRSNGTDFVTPQMLAASDELLHLKGTFLADLAHMKFHLNKGTFLALFNRYHLHLDGDVALPSDAEDLRLDLCYNTNQWPLQPLLALLPSQFTEWQHDFKELDGKLKIVGTAQGQLGVFHMPKIDARIQLDNGRFYAPSMLPYDLQSIEGELTACINTDEGATSKATIHQLTAVTGKNRLSLTGTVYDLLGRKDADLRLKGDVLLADVLRLIPDDVPIDMKGKSKVDIHLRTDYEHLVAVDLKNMIIDGTLNATDFQGAYDDISAQSPQVTIALRIPATTQTRSFREMCTVTIKGDHLHAVVPSANLDANLEKANIVAGLSDFMDTALPFSLVANYSSEKLNATMDTVRAQFADPEGTFELVPDSRHPDQIHYRINHNNSALYCRVNDSLSLNLAGLTVKGTAHYDSTRANVLKQWSPNLDIDLKRAYINQSQLDYMIQVPDMKFNYQPERCEITSANVVFGNSDFYLSGAVTGLEDWISHKDMLRGDLYFTSNYTNVDDLMDAISGLGSDPDTLQQQRQEDHVAKEANPFIVPRDVDFTLHTRIKDATAYGNELQELAGDVMIRDGVAVLDQVGFVCKAATMQLTALYRTPRVNHIFLGMDFHLLDINVSELIDMIPMVDTIVPMLSALDGHANFHLCAETYCDAFYQPKYSTLRGAASLVGDSLVVIDNETFEKISKLMLFNRKTKNIIDSLDVELTVFKKEVELFPFLISMDKYQVIASGRHNLDKNYNYHLEIIQSPLPTRLAVEALGIMPKINIRLAKCRYAELYKPEKQNAVQEQTLRLKELIRTSLESNVRQSTKDIRKVR